MYYTAVTGIMILIRFRFIKRQSCLCFLTVFCVLSESDRKHDIKAILYITDMVLYTTYYITSQAICKVFFSDIEPYKQ